MEIPELVYIDEYGLHGENFYWTRRERFGFSDEVLIAIGVSDARVQVHPDLTEPLLLVDSKLRSQGCRLHFKEGYRPAALYDLIYQRWVRLHGQADADSIFNMADRPHATGKSVDVVLWNVAYDKELYMRDGNDGTPAFFVDFYRGRTDEKSVLYHGRQLWLIELMQDHGFRLGKKREYFHFEYRPDEPPNYP